MQLWRNPELVRHLRAQLRVKRAAAIAVVVLIVCALVWVASWASREEYMAVMRQAAIQYHWPVERLAHMERESLPAIWLHFYQILMYAQLALFTFWCLISCAQSVSGERERKTWDFQRMTQLTSNEIMIGKLLGEPALAYFIVLCCFPIMLLGGWRAGISLVSVLSAYLLLLAAGLFVGLIGVWLSSLFESRSRGIGLIGSVGIYLLLASSMSLEGSPMPGLAAFCPLPEWIGLLGDSSSNYQAFIFGARVSWLLMSLLLYGTFGAWLVVMLTRNLKRDYDEISTLSRWQTIGGAAFLNFVAYALFHPSSWGPGLDSYQFLSFAVFINAAILFALGLAVLTPYERLKIWARGRQDKGSFQSMFSEYGPPLPWIVLSGAVAYLLSVFGLLTWRQAIPLQNGLIQRSAAQFAILLLFVCSSILFLQWCRLTRMRAPVLKGVLYLGLYYSAATVIGMGLSVHSESVGLGFWNIFTPLFAFRGQTFVPDPKWSIVLGVILQLGFVYYFLMMIGGRLKSPDEHGAPRLATESSY